MQVRTRSDITGIVSGPGGSRCSAAATLFVLLATAVCNASASESALAAPSPSATDILQAAFDTRFNFDLVQVVDLKARSEMGEQSRTIQMATKRVGNSLHGLGYFVAPPELRGMRLLMIERFDRNDDFFVFVPTQGKVRRISSAQRADAFMGTDLTYEDFERRYVEDYHVTMVGPSESGGEGAYEIRCAPKYESGHTHAVYFIAQSDNAILEIRYYRGDQAEPIKVQRVPRSEMISVGGHIVPTQMYVTDQRRGRHTEVRFSQIQIDPKLEDGLFTRSALEVGRPIPFLHK